MLHCNTLSNTLCVISHETGITTVVVYLSEHNADLRKSIVPLSIIDNAICLISIYFANGFKVKLQTPDSPRYILETSQNTGAFYNDSVSLQPEVASQAMLDPETADNNNRSNEQQECSHTASPTSSRSPATTAM
jgi:hypothetical protein